MQVNPISFCSSTYTFLSEKMPIFLKDKYKIITLLVVSILTILTTSYILLLQRRTKLRKEIEIFAKTSDDQITTYHVSENDRVDSLKTRISQRIGEPLTDIRLHLKTVVLEDNKTLKSYHINNHSLILVIPSKNIEIEGLGGIKKYKVFLGDTIKDLKHQIKQQEGLPLDQQITIHQEGEKLEDDDRLTYSLACDGFGTVCWAPKVKTEEIHISVKVSEAQLDYTVETGDKIEFLKKKLAKKLGFFWTKDIELSFNGQTLADNNTFASYQIKNGASIHFVHNPTNENYAY